MDIATRTSLCLQCRTALFDGEPCDQGSEHTSASMADIYGREALIATVWGPVRERERELRAFMRSEQSLSGLGTVGTIIGSVASAVLFPVDTAGMLIGGASMGTLFWSCGRLVMGRRTPTYPVGAEPLGFGRGTGARGAVEGDAMLVSPASDTECVAYSLELHYEGSFGDRVMFRDAVCTAFTVKLDGGVMARVPAGRIRLLGAMRQEVDVDNLGLEHHLEAFDPQRSAEAPFDPLRYNVVYEQLLLPGDRVELVSAFEPVVDTAALPTHYRESAPSVLAPRGVPVVRLDPTLP